MTDGTNPQSTPQPEPAPGSGGYGFPPGPPAQGGYGFPPGTPAQGGYGFPPGPAPQDGYGFPHGTPPQDAGGYGYPQPGQQPNPYQVDPGAQQAPWSPAQPGTPGGDQPDWEAMADRSAAERRRKRLWMLGGGVSVLALLAAGGTFFLLGGNGDGTDDQADGNPPASASPGPSGSKSPAPYSPTVEGDATLLRDSNGRIGIRLGPDTQVGPVGKRFQIVSKGTANSYGQAAEPAVDVSKSFTVTARVYSSNAKGSRIAVSQGDGESFSFELGIDMVNGKQAWIFRVQTGDKGAAATTQTVVAEGLNMVKTATVLMATYDAEKKTIALYVEGKKAGEAAVPGIWQAPGPLQLGRSRHHNIWSGAWQGAMHNIRVYESAFSQEQATAYKEGKLGAAPKPSHSWLLT
ncbi:LamG-like jellyroll fold domain-containing protein [Streptomyces sp. CB00455]|uniref:LamG-like jellyroll fold domain-containing protein n=1 Tax=Streptomyces sp. CB00455 TaxID=1703927 RepID=UPI00093F0AF0|nr:LamG-like jellyroll fold domain-containing protein [Streptomyces sp. CB00455]